eukprot:TRINITY_DN37_c0_g1_i1.p1 TRINITY_DN37_c0_g1~~TRINITY_DN37_c0_g1_i1.p1  ORF type:complete len:175 (-),score=5.76 TRINITY_DN37_c0_g1_i1:232-756(-)
MCFDNGSALQEALLEGKQPGRPFCKWTLIHLTCCASDCGCDCCYEFGHFPASLVKKGVKPAFYREIKELHLRYFGACWKFILWSLLVITPPTAGLTIILIAWLYARRQRHARTEFGSLNRKWLHPAGVCASLDWEEAPKKCCEGDGDRAHVPVISFFNYDPGHDAECPESMTLV